MRHGDTPTWEGRTMQREPPKNGGGSAAPGRESRDSIPVRVEVSPATPTARMFGVLALAIGGPIVLIPVAFLAIFASAAWIAWLTSAAFVLALVLLVRRR